MKRCLFPLCLLFMTGGLRAQIEIKSVPIAWLFEALPVAVEFPLRNDMAVEAELILLPEISLYGTATFRYYLEPSVLGHDKFYLCGFAGAYRDGVGPGFGIGYKWVSAKNILFDLGAGIGRSLNSPGEYEALPWGRAHLGYRFRKKK